MSCGDQAITLSDSYIGNSGQHELSFIKSTQDVDIALVSLVIPFATTNVKNI